MKILDSDHCISILRGRLNLEEFVTADDVLGVTTISIGELIHGAYKSAKPDENVLSVNLLVAAMRTLDFDDASARRFGRLKADLEKEGQRLADLDLQIASVALVHEATLVTHNKRHFARISDLALEDWISDG